MDQFGTGAAAEQAPGTKPLDPGAEKALSKEGRLAKFLRFSSRDVTLLLVSMLFVELSR